jgi:phage shock protein A
MSQQGIVGRVMQLARANVNAVLDSAEDPRVMLDDLVFDYSTHIAGAEHAITQTVANLHMIEQDLKEDARAAQQWGKKAQAASKKADELRGSGRTKDADRFDDLARIAIERQMTVQNDVSTIQRTIDAQNESLAKLKAGLDRMKVKLSELKRRGTGTGTRGAPGRRTAAPGAGAGPRSSDASDRIDILDPASEVSRFEEKVRREEARAGGRSKLAASSLDRQFMALDDPANRAEIEQRLQALKAGRGPAGRKPAHSQRGKASRVSAGRRPARAERTRAGVH